MWLRKDIGRPNTQHNANTIAARLLRTLHVPSTYNAAVVARLFHRVEPGGLL